MRSIRKRDAYLRRGCAYPGLSCAQVGHGSANLGLDESFSGQCRAKVGQVSAYIGHVHLSKTSVRSTPKLDAYLRRGRNIPDYAALKSDMEVLILVSKNLFQDNFALKLDK